MLSFRLRIRIGEQDLLLPIQATSSSPPLPVKAGWRGRSPSLDASRHVPRKRRVIKRYHLFARGNL
jgi:hypothetical protein